MFSDLFIYPSTLARHRTALCAESRERFLRQCADQGYSQSMLQKIAWIVLVLSQDADLCQSKRVTCRQIEFAVDDLSPRIVRLFLTDMEQQRNCATSTRNQRLGGIHALARFIAEHSPEHIDWCTQIRLIPFKKTSQPAITYLEKLEMDALLATPDCETTQGRREYGVLLFLYNSGARVSTSVTRRRRYQYHSWLVGTCFYQYYHHLC